MLVSGRVDTFFIVRFTLLTKGIWLLYHVYQFQGPSFRTNVKVSDFVMKQGSVAIVFDPTNQHQHMEYEKYIFP